MRLDQSNHDAMGKTRGGARGKAVRARARDALWTLWTPLARIAARGYVAGAHLPDALRVSESLSRQGFGITLCYWSPVGTPAREVAEAYRLALGSRPTDGWCLSMKAPEIGYSRELAGRVAREARQAGVSLHFDSHGPETAEPTFALIGGLLRECPAIGCTLPGRWRRSLGDAERALEWGLRVRVVKGQWREPGEPERDPGHGCLELIERLAGGRSHIALASHNPALVREGLTRLLETQTSCELELLFGLPMAPATTVARALGVPVRVYIPYGYGWLPYCFTQVTRNPRILWWLLRDVARPRPTAAL